MWLEWKRNYMVFQVFKNNCEYEKSANQCHVIFKCYLSKMKIIMTTQTGENTTTTPRYFPGNSRAYWSKELNRIKVNTYEYIKWLNITLPNKAIFCRVVVSTSMSTRYSIHYVQGEDVMTGISGIWGSYTDNCNACHVLDSLVQVHHKVARANLYR